jgi:CxxC motif-containing protein
VVKERKIICIVCPLACNVNVTLNNEGAVLNITGNQCKEGQKYAVSECQFPGRVLTTTVLIENHERRLLPVRSDRPIPKDKLMDCICFLAPARVKAPVKMGQVIASNIAGTGANMISSDELSVQKK